jgi:hypothetical protein
MVTIEILNGIFISIVDEAVKLKIEMADEDGNLLHSIWLSKSQAETLAAILSVMEKQLD